MCAASGDKGLIIVHTGAGKVNPSVSFQKVGEDGVFAGGEAARKHPAPHFTEMIPTSGGNEMEELVSKLTVLDERIKEIQVRL